MLTNVPHVQLGAGPRLAILPRLGALQDIIPVNVHVGGVHDDVHVRRHVGWQLVGDGAFIVAGVVSTMPVNDVHAARVGVEPNPGHSRTIPV